MAGLSQTQSLSQQQVLAPQLQQSLQILQAPMLELRNLIQQELQTNPTLEDESSEPTIEDKQEEREEFQEEFDRLAKLDEEWRDYMAQSSSYSGRSSEDEERRQFFFDSLVKEETLQQHLFEQVRSSDSTPTDRDTRRADHRQHRRRAASSSPPRGDRAEYRHGRRRTSQRVLEIVQTFHPVGVGSRDLRECLLIQLERIGKEGSLE